MGMAGKLLSKEGVMKETLYIGAILAMLFWVCRSGEGPGSSDSHGPQVSLATADRR